MRRRRPVPHCAACGIAEDNGVGIGLRRFHLRPARGFGERTGTTVIGSILLCDRCLREAGLLPAPPRPRQPYEVNANDVRLVHRVPA